MSKILGHQRGQRLSDINGGGSGVDATGVEDGKVLMSEGEVPVWDHAGYAPYSPNTPSDFPNAVPGSHTLANCLDYLGSQVRDQRKGAYVGTVTGTVTGSGMGLSVVIDEASVYAYDGDDATQDTTHSWLSVDGSQTISLLEPGRYVVRYYWQIDLSSAGNATVRSQLSGNSGPVQAVLSGTTGAVLIDTVFIDLFDSYTFPQPFTIGIDVMNGSGRLTAGGLFMQIFKLA